MAVVGCAAQPAVSLPRKSGALADSASLANPKQTRRQQVIAAYLGYWQAFGEAMDSRSAARAKAILAPYDPPSAIAQAVKADRPVWAAHEIAYGSADPHILSVHLTGHHALVNDCLDLSHFGVQDVHTGRVVAGSFGLPRLNFYVTLVFSRGRWLVSRLQQVEVPCVP